MAEVGQKSGYFAFFELPREVRDQILNHFCGDRYVSVSTCRHHDPTHELPTLPFIKNLGVSRRFYEEAISIFYSTSEFVFTDIKPFRRLLGELDICHQSRFQELTLFILATEVDEWLLPRGIPIPKNAPENNNTTPQVSVGLENFITT